MAGCDDTRQLTEAQRQAGYQNQRTGVQQAVRPFTGRPTLENLIDYINRELQPAVKRTRDKVNDIYLPVVDNAPSGNPLGFYFSDNTANADPTAGRIRLNAATQDTATIIRVSESNGRLAGVAPWLDVMAGSVTSPLGVVTLSDAVNPARFIRFDLTAMSDQGSYWNLTVTPVESSHDNPFVDGGAVVLSFIPGVGSTPATIPPTAISGADGPRQFLATSTGTAVDWRTSSAIFPGAPIYDVMAYPFNAVGNGIADDTAAINAAIAAANVTSGYIYLGNRHKISAALTPLARDAIGIIGRGCRGDGTLITATGATPYNVFTIDTVKDCVIRDLFIEGPGTWASRGLGIFIDNAFRTRIERVEIQDTYGAIEIYGSVITEIVDTYAAAILGPYAFYAYGSVADGENHALRFIGCATGTDVSGGTIIWYKQGSGSHTFELINCGALEGGYGLYVVDDTPYTGSRPLFTRCLNFQADHCAINGIRLVNGATANFTHVFITSTSAGNAFQVDSTYSGNWEINGGMFHATAGHGVVIGCDHWSITGLQVGNIDAGFDMINIAAGVNDFSITGCTLGDIFGNNSVARYGINIAATCDRYTIVGNRIIGNDTGAINDGPGPATSRVIEGNTPTSVNTVRIDEIETMAVGTTVGRRVDAGSTGRPVALTGAEQAENWRRATIQTVSGVSGTLDILLNDDTTVLLIRTTADATLRTLGDGLATAGREVVIEHDRLSGTGNLTIAHNTVGTYSTFFNPDTSSVVLGQTTCCTVRLRSGFWRPQGSAQARIRDADYGDITVSSSGATWTIDNGVVTLAKQADMAQSRFQGRAESAGTGAPQALTPTQAVAIIDGENATWTGVHSFTGASHTIDVTGAVAVDADAASHFTTSVGNLTLSTTAAGSRVIVSGADDVLIEAVADDMFINSGNDMVVAATGDLQLNGAAGTLLMAMATPSTTVSTGEVRLHGDTNIRLLTNGTERLEIESDGAWQLGGDTGSLGGALLSQGSSASPIWGDRSDVVTRTTIITGGSSAEANIVSHAVTAGTWVVGTTYEFYAHCEYVRSGAAATSHTVTIDAELNGTGIGISLGVLSGTQNSATATVLVAGTFTCSATGGSGTGRAAIAIDENILVGSTAALSRWAGTSSPALDTTASNTLSITVDFSAGIAGVSFVCQRAWIRRVV